jgi:hypothetical protein
MQRIIVPTEKFHSEQLMPGVSFERFYPGGKKGPKGECLFDTPGGQGWTDSFLLGDSDDAFQMSVPDIRLPANQLWPLHWHDCWTAVVVFEGQCLIGDWWMQPGDLFITEPSLGPLSSTRRVSTWSFPLLRSRLVGRNTHKSWGSKMRKAECA